MAFAVILLTGIAVGCADSSPQRGQLSAAKAALSSGNYAMAIQDSSAAATPPSPAQTEAEFIHGLALEQRPKADQASADRDLAAARSQYQLALSQNPPRTLESRLHAQLGNVEFFQNDYAAALPELARADQQFTDPQWKQWVEYRVGICLQRLGRFADADRTFQQVVSQYPGTDAAKRCAERIGIHGFYVQVGAFSQAADAERAAGAITAAGAAPVRVSNKGLTVIRTTGVASYAQALAIRSRLTGTYPDAMVMP